LRELTTSYIYEVACPNLCNFQRTVDAWPNRRP
jgi:hypothetical protein